MAEEALYAGRNVFLYSDNVPIEHEVALKRKAREKGLLVMGPDCGTAVLGGVGLGFANSPAGFAKPFSATGLAKSSVNLRLSEGSSTRSCGRFGPATLGVMRARSSSSTLLKSHCPCFGMANMLRTSPFCGLVSCKKVAEGFELKRIQLGTDPGIVGVHRIAGFRLRRQLNPPEPEDYRISAAPHRLTSTRGSRPRNARPSDRSRRRLTAPSARRATRP